MREEKEQENEAEQEEAQLIRVNYFWGLIYGLTRSPRAP